MTVESNCCSVSTNVENVSLFTGSVLKLNLEEGARILDEFKEALLVHEPPSDAKVQHFCHVDVLFK